MLGAGVKRVRGPPRRGTVVACRERPSPEERESASARRACAIHHVVRGACWALRGGAGGPPIRRVTLARTPARVGVYPIPWLPCAQGVFRDPTILDVSDVELVDLKFLEEDPVVVVQFTCQQLNCARDKCAPGPARRGAHRLRASRLAVSQVACSWLAVAWEAARPWPAGAAAASCPAGGGVACAPACLRHACAGPSSKQTRLLPCVSEQAGVVRGGARVRTRRRRVTAPRARSRFGNVVEGAADEVQRVYYYWALQQDAAGFVGSDGRVYAPRWQLREMMMRGAHNLL